jgi:hypothetical protein
MQQSHLRLFGTNLAHKKAVCKPNLVKADLLEQQVKELLHTLIKQIRIKKSDNIDERLAEEWYYIFPSSI